MIRIQTFPIFHIDFHPFFPTHMNHSKSSTSSITPTYFSSSSSQSKTSSPGNLPTIHYLRQPRNLNGPFRLSRVVAYHIIIIIDTRANFVLRNPIHSVPISTNPCLPHATPKRLYPHTHTHTHTHTYKARQLDKSRGRVIATRVAEEEARV